MFFKKIKLVAKTNVKDLADVFPMVPAGACLPNWYKDMKLSYTVGECPVQRSITNQKGTIKGCEGVNKLLTRGFVIAAWQDMSIFIYPDGRVSFDAALKDKISFEVHDARQAPPHWKDHVIFKLVSPWFLFGDETEYMLVPMPLHSTLPIEHFIPSGIVNFKNQHSTNVFFMVKPRAEVYEIFIKAGQPLVQLIPLAEKKVDLRVEYDAAFSSASPTRFFMLHAYRRYLNAIRQKDFK